MTLLPATGAISYNGFTFPAALNSSVETEPQYDTARRTIKSRRYSLTIHFTVTAVDLGLSAGTAIDTGITTLRRQLEEAGKTLIFSGQGFGALTVNQDNVLDFGPLPGRLRWEPVGSNLAARIIWTCEFDIVECNQAANGAFGELTYSLDWTIREDGSTVRTISGRAEARVARQSDGSRLIDNTADTLWDLLKFPTLQGFKRIRNHTLSSDRRYILFTLTDTEIQSDNPYPARIVNIDMSQRVSGGLSIAAGGLVNWQVSFDATIEVAPGQPRFLAWQAFLLIIANRLSDYSSSRFINLAVDWREDIFRRTVTFHVAYLLTKVPTFDVLRASGIWKPTPTDWGTWTASMTEAQSPRGYAKLRYENYNDVIVDFCHTGGTPLTPNVVLRPNPAYQQPLLTSTPPPESESWWAFQNELEYTHEPDNIYFGTIKAENANPSENQITEGPPDPTLGGSPNDDPVLQGAYWEITGPSSTIDRSGAYIQDRSSKLYLVMHGSAIRLGHRIKQIPYVATINGTKAVLARKERVRNLRIGMVGDVPIYAATWEKVYYGAKGEVVIKNVPPEFQNVRPAS